jgi:hypothetical protein
VLALAETPHLLGRLQQELGRERYHSLWRELVVSLNTAPVD